MHGQLLTAPAGEAICKARCQRSHSQIPSLAKPFTKLVASNSICKVD